MLRSLLACLGTRSPRDPRRAEDKGERRGRFGRRRKTVGGVDEGDACSGSTFGCLKKRREKVARSAQLDEDLCDGNVKVCSLEAESTETLKVVNQVQLHADVSLPTESLEVIDQVHCPALSTEPSSVVDWDAKITAAHEKFQASSARVREAVRKFDQRLIEPLFEKKQIFIPPPCHTQQKVASRVLFTEVFREDALEVMKPVEYATLSVEHPKVASRVLCTEVFAVAAQELIEPGPVAVARVSVPVATPEESVTMPVQQVSDSRIRLVAADPSFKMFDQPIWPAQEARTWKGQMSVCCLTNKDLHFGHEQRVILPFEPVEMIDRVLNRIASVSFEPNVIDPGARMAAAQQPFLGSRVHAHQAVQSSDQHLTEPMSERNQNWNANAGAASQMVRRRQSLKLFDDEFWTAGKEQWPRVCPLLGTASSEAVYHEQLDPEEFLPSEPLEKIDPICYVTLAVSVQPDAVDWDAKFAAARQKFRASSARLRQAVEDFDRRLIEPMMERSLSCVFPQ